MIKAIIFDFDGVVLDSVGIKTQAFADLFTQYPADRIELITKYHMEKGGLSRYLKFKYIYKNILLEELTAQQERKLGEQYSKLVFDGILTCSFIPGAQEFLKKYKGQYLFFVASGTPEEELKDIIKKRGLEGCFKKIYGSPTSKVDIIQEILQANKLNPQEVVFIGDSQTDADAAKETGLSFVLVHGDGNVRSKWNVEDLTQFKKILDTIKSNMEISI